ncbi:hypothetical protein DSO57_1007849 [Entomophthora muscae]|uniref:Uncharacterized protein n=1 Tax=Entomophthora muscae TaxID=34485 RepID=A0ACC2RYF4_9FUNG|nr:hypothetical protein DSO57_1007849 [Entomophthora muscae]
MVFLGGELSPMNPSLKDLPYPKFQVKGAQFIWLGLGRGVKPFFEPGGLSRPLESIHPPAPGAGSQYDRALHGQPILEGLLEYVPVFSMAGSLFNWLLPDLMAAPDTWGRSSKPESSGVTNLGELILGGPNPEVEVFLV